MLQADFSTFHIHELVLRGESKATLKCYLPALRFVSGLDKPLPTQVTKVLVNADAPQINLVLTNHDSDNTNILLFAVTPGTLGADAGEADAAAQQLAGVTSERRRLLHAGREGWSHLEPLDRVHRLDRRPVRWWWHRAYHRRRRPRFTSNCKSRLHTGAATG